MGDALNSDVLQYWQNRGTANAGNLSPALSLVPAVGGRRALGLSGVSRTLLNRETPLLPDFQKFISERNQQAIGGTAPKITPTPTTEPQPIAVNKTGSSDYRHGGTTPKKKKVTPRASGSVRRALLLSGGGEKLG